MKTRCLVLVSGGLDSSLAALLMKERGFDVAAVNCVTGFEPAADGADCAGRVCAALGITLHRLDIRARFLEIVRRPELGYGKNLNPCLDCKILMLRSAWQLAGRLGAPFLVTGEVLGQRPMSQHAASLALIEKKAGLDGHVFRPLSAAFLPETEPERRGLVSRDGWPSISGRNRRALLDLAAARGLENFSPPAGGCLLTDRIFARRLRDLLTHDLFTLPEIELLRLGRHFRLTPSAKLVVGRDEGENRALEGRAAGRILYVSLGCGPSALLTAGADAAERDQAARLVASYGDEARRGEPVRLRVAGVREPLVVAQAPDRDKWRPFLI